MADKADPELLLDFTSVGPLSGGVGVVATGVATGLMKSEVDFVALTTSTLGRSWRENHPELSPSIREITVRLDSGNGWQIRLRRFLPRNRATQRAIGWVRGVRARSVSRDLNHGVVWSPFHRSPISSDRTVVTVHDLRVFEPELESPMDQDIISANVRRAAAVVCSWPHPHESLVSRFPEAREKSFIIPLPVLNPGPPRLNAALKGSSVRLLFPGYVTPHKNHEVIIRGLALDPRYTAVFTGSEDRDHGTWLRRLSQELGVAERIEWRGFVSSDDLENEYQTADLMVMPTRWEAASGPIFESIVRELPFVASDIPPIRSQVRSLGLPAELFKWDDPESFVTAVERTLSDYGSHVDRIRSVAGRIRDRTWEQTARDYARVFDWVAGRGARPDELMIGHEA